MNLISDSEFYKSENEMKMNVIVKSLVLQKF